METGVTRLTQTSYVVLGLVDACQPATPYDLKRFAEISVFNFWTVPHTQIYAESARLAQAGLLDEQREKTGRRRRIYRLTDAGRAELENWRREPAFAGFDLRDVGLVKLFFGADPRKLAETELEGHRAKLAAYEDLAAQELPMTEGQRLALEGGIGHEREYVRFWAALAAGKRP
jgi:PadR family transcriptional regulator, regulatory protein AphA